MPEIRYTKVVGVSHKNSDGSSRQSIIRKYAEPDSSVILERDYENEYSDHAVAVLIIDDDFEERQIGYLSDEFAEELHDKLEKVRCIVKNVTGGEGEKHTLGVNLEMAVYSDEEYQEWLVQKQKATPPPIIYKPEQPESQPTKSTKKPRANKKDISPKSRTIALVLCVLIGYFGAHHFYAGRKGIGAIYIFTVGGFIFGWAIDFILILLGQFKDKSGRYISNW